MDKYIALILIMSIFTLTYVLIVPFTLNKTIKVYNADNQKLVNRAASLSSFGYIFAIIFLAVMCISIAFSKGAQYSSEVAGFIDMLMKLGIALSIGVFLYNFVMHMMSEDSFKLYNDKANVILFMSMCIFSNLLSAIVAIYFNVYNFNNEVIDNTILYSILFSWIANGFMLVCMPVLRTEKCPDYKYHNIWSILSYFVNNNETDDEDDISYFDPSTLLYVWQTTLAMNLGIGLFTTINYNKKMPVFL